MLETSSSLFSENVLGSFMKTAITKDTATAGKLLLGRLLVTLEEGPAGEERRND